MRTTLLLLAVTSLLGCGSDKLPAGGRDGATQPDGGTRPDGASRPDGPRVPDGPRRPDAQRDLDATDHVDANPECRNPVEGQPCATEGLICPADCSDRCQFCNLWSCRSRVWTRLEAFPDPTCGRDAGPPGDGGSSPDAARTCGAAGAATPNAPPVEISFEGLGCTFTLAQAAQGLRLPYTVRVTATTPDVIPLPSDAGGCARPGPSGLSIAASVSGNGQRYCLCDTGLCPAPPTTPVTLQPGSFPGALEWRGRNWSGPSDTNNPMGAAFPPGSYSFTVSTRGLRRTPTGDVPFELSATREIVLTR